jgi:heme O synthase-like polyprenyltransferase
VRHALAPSRNSARWMVLASVLYLPALLALMVLDKAA